MGRRDFDFFHGEWEVVNHRLVAPLTGSAEWSEFPAHCSVRGLVDGIGFVDEMTFPTLESSGTTIGLFDPVQDRWAHYWVSSRDGQLQPAVLGGLDADGRGEFYGDDTFADQPIRVRYSWESITEQSFVWHQAFSTDGQTWEINWTMNFRRA